MARLAFGFGAAGAGLGLTNNFDAGFDSGDLTEARISSSEYVLSSAGLLSGGLMNAVSSWLSIRGSSGRLDGGIVLASGGPPDVF